MQYTIRNIPGPLDQALRQRAQRENKSLNAVVVETLAQAAGLGQQRSRKRNLGKFLGKWVEDPAFDEAMKDFERVNEEAWR